MASVRGSIYGDAPLPTGEQALNEPFRAFPSWFIRIVCERCGKERMLSETHIATGRRDAPRHPRAHAPCRLRLRRGAGGVAHRHRGGEQQAGAADRAARGMKARWLADQPS